MILSEFAGAAQSLNGSIIVNPWDSQQLADAIHEAVTMDMETRQKNQKKLFKYVNKYSAAYWGTSFVNEMSRLSPGGGVEKTSATASAPTTSPSKANGASSKPTANGIAAGMKTPEPEVPGINGKELGKMLDPMMQLESKGTDQKAGRTDEGVELGKAYGV